MYDQKDPYHTTVIKGAKKMYTRKILIKQCKGRGFSCLAKIKHLLLRSNDLYKQ